MNCKTLQIARNLFLNSIGYTKSFYFSHIQYKNYHCEKWIKEQKIKKYLENDLTIIKSLNLNQKEIFFNNKIDKILEQNKIIKIQNEKISSIIANLHNNTNNTNN